MADEVQIPDELTITPRKPIEFSTVTYSTLQLREPTAAEWEQWDQIKGVAANIKAISVVSGWPEGAVRQLGVRDLTTAAKFIDHFF